MDLKNNLESCLNKNSSQINSTFKSLTNINKVCKICGDKALGYNFGIISCESCKAFFRRNALRNKNFICPFVNNCEVDVVTRRFCQKCRLKKCFDSGMKKEWILSDDEKKLKRLKIEENKQKQKHNINNFFSKSNLKDDTFYREDLNLNSNHANYNSEIKNNHFSSSIHLSSLDEHADYNLSTMLNINNEKLNLGSFNNNTNLSTHNQTEPYQTKPFLQDRQGVQHSNIDYQPGLESNSIYSNYNNSFSSNLLPNQINIINSRTNLEMKNKLLLPICEDTSFSNYFPQTNFVFSNSNFEQTSSINNSNSCLNNIILEKNIEEQYNAVFQTKSNPSFSKKNSNNSKTASNKSPSNNYSSNNSLSSNLLSNNSPSNNTFLNNSPSNKIECRSDEKFLDILIDQVILSQFTVCSCQYNNEIDADFSDFNELELKIINEVLQADSNIVVFKEEKLKFDTFLQEVIQITDFGIRQLIKVSKKITYFRNLCEEDQISLLKGGLIEMILLKSVLLYKESEDTIVDHTTNYKINFGLIKNIKESIYNEHKQLIFLFREELRKDKLTVWLMICIKLFSPGRAKLYHQITIKYIQKVYCYLLKRYILIKYKNKTDADKIYLELLDIYKKVGKLSEKYIEVYLNLNSEIIGPLLFEIFNINT